MKKKKLSHQVVEYILSRDIQELADITQDSLAHYLEINPPILAQEFEKDQHITLQGFIIREKLHRAAIILETATSPAIEALSQKLGFATPSDFNREFQSYLAVEPEKYWAFTHNLNKD